ncbi:hypothetical protein ACH5RR_026264 [Cinchona calisaya]|uniref:RNase H type-1 domain-containing protein n=1 Tax=Cinchona calisaya TaxID=153742 RepID=A0ABD2Z5A5_9GENT
MITTARWIILRVESLLQASSFGQPFTRSSSLLNAPLLLPISITSSSGLWPVSIGWHKPPPNHSYKLNVNGSALGNPGPAGIDGIIRDLSGEVLLGFARHFGTATDLETESKALLVRVQLCIHHHFKSGSSRNGLFDSSANVTWATSNTMEHRYNIVTNSIPSTTRFICYHSQWLTL